MQVPCGQCIGCRLDRAKDWGVRISLEAKMHDRNSFLTLTYSDENLPAGGSLVVRDLQLFIKRFREEIRRQDKREKRNHATKIRYYACGEYGEKLARPHYHLVIFGYDFEDKILWRKSPSGYDLFRSPQLEKLWPYGHSEIGSVSANSGGYVARYVLKKITGSAAENHYSRVDPVSGERWSVLPEFALMSSRPGIARGWYDAFRNDCFPSDFLVLDGSKVAVPDYFLRLARREVDTSKLRDVGTAADVSRARRAAAREPRSVWNNSDERLAVREELAEYRLEKLKRDFER